MNRKIEGFGIVGIIVIAVGLVIVGLVGWRVWDANRTKESSNTTTNQQESNGGTQPTPQPSATYLDIKELGVKVKLSEDIKDAVYYYDVNYNAQYPDYPQVTISTQSLIDRSGGL